MLYLHCNAETIWISADQPVAIVTRERGGLSCYHGESLERREDGKRKTEEDDENE